MPQIASIIGKALVPPESRDRIYRRVREYPITRDATMPAAIFQIRLGVQPTRGGNAALVPPEMLQGLPYHFI
jgi:hypothetical protein